MKLFAWLSQSILYFLFFSGNLLAQNHNPLEGCVNQGAPFIEIPGKILHGYSLAPTKENDGFYLGGLLNDSAMLIRFDLQGEIIWARTFDIVPGLADHISAVLLDSDGMLAVSGTSGEIDNVLGGPIFVFRYDPENDQVLWTKEFVPNDTRNYNWTIIEKNAGGNYILSTLPVDNGNINIELFELSRSTGAVMPGIYTNLDLSTSDELTSMLMYNGFLYGNGRLGLDGATDSYRQVLIKIDPADGSIVWSKVGHRPANASARFYGVDLLIENEAIYNLTFGDPNSGSLNNTNLYMQKTSLDGNVSWVKQYQLPGTNDWGYEIQKSGNGIVILAAQRAQPYAYYLFKIDFEGNVLWAQEFPLDNPFYTGHPLIGDYQMIEAGGELVWTGYEVTTGSETKLLIIRTDLNGIPLGLCTEYKPVNIPVSSVENPVFFDVNLIEKEPDFSVQKIKMTSNETILPMDSNCVLSDTIFYTVRDTICTGDSLEGYTESGTYEDHFLTSGGCDSFRVLELVVLDNMVTTFKKTICQGDVFLGYSQTGIYLDTFSSANSCDSIRMLTLRAVDCKELIRYNLDACSSFMSNGSHMDYSEFDPQYPNTISCGQLSATNVFRDPPQENKHSCTPGVENSIAMCISASTSCTYLPGNSASLVFETTITPAEDSVVRITGLTFFEKSPATYSWISGPGGPNNYPKFYGLRVLKNNVEIFRQKDIPTSQVWSLQAFDFLNLDAFNIDAASVIRFELFPYCPIGNGALVSAWDIDEIKVSGGCWPAQISQPVISGVVRAMDGRMMKDVEIDLSATPDFSNSERTLTDNEGNYQFDHLASNTSYYLKGSNNGALLNGVNTFDLLKIQKHLLGIETFTHPDQFIAADVNHSASVTVMDILELRKALLGKISSFPGNTSWRFGSFDDHTTFNEIQFKTLIEDQTILNWNGIKIGDLNNDVVLNVEDNQLQPRTDVTFELGYIDQPLDEGEEVTVTFTTLSEIELEGFQFILKADDLELMSAKGNSLAFNSDHYQVHADGLIWISWSQAKFTRLEKNDGLLTLKFIAKRKGNLSELLNIVGQPLHPQAYLNHGIESLGLRNLSRKNYADKAIGEINIHPNPFQESTKIELDMQQPGRVGFAFYDLSGHLIYKIEKLLPFGKQELEFDKRELGSQNGIITCQIICQDQVITEKLVMIR